MKLIINGKNKIFEKNISNIDDLLTNLNIDKDVVVVELNGDIVDKENYKTSQITENDKIEIIRFMGGG